MTRWWTCLIGARLATLRSQFEQSADLIENGMQASAAARAQAAHDVPSETALLVFHHQTCTAHAGRVARSRSQSGKLVSESARRAHSSSSVASGLVPPMSSRRTAPAPDGGRRRGLGQVRRRTDRMLKTASRPWSPWHAGATLLHGRCRAAVHHTCRWTACQPTRFFPVHTAWHPRPAARIGPQVTDQIRHDRF